jgi:hypothetical protein
LVQLGSSFGGPQIACPNCRQPISVQLEQVIDVGSNPAGKARLLSGVINTARCTNCGMTVRMAAPLVYHDLAKELFIIYVPMELGLPQAEQERMVGSMTQAVINSIPQNQRKGYLFMPKHALTMQGMLEMVLEADGVTKEMLEARRQKVRLLETFLQTEPEQWGELATQMDAQLDREFFEVITSSAEAAVANGRRDVADQLLGLRDTLLQNTTEGQALLHTAQTQEAVIQEVATALNALGQQVSYEDLVELAIAQGTQSDERLQVLVGLARPALDYGFFSAFTAHIEAAPEADQEALTAIRDRLVQLTSMADQASQSVIEQAASLLNEIMTAEDIDQAIQGSLPYIDDMFLQVLQANIQRAEQQRDMISAGRLRSVLDKVMQTLDQAAPPVVRFINELLGLPSMDEASELLAARASEFGPELLQWFDTLAEQISSSGGNPTMISTIQALRGVAEQVLGDGRTISFPGAGERAPQPAQPPAPDVDSQKSGIVLPFSARKKRSDS